MTALFMAMAITASLLAPTATAEIWSQPEPAVTSTTAPVPTATATKATCGRIAVTTGTDEPIMLHAFELDTGVIAYEGDNWWIVDYVFGPTQTLEWPTTAGATYSWLIHTVIDGQVINYRGEVECT